MKDNPMRTIDIDRIVLNIGVGEAGEKLRKATRVIELLTDSRKPLTTLSKKTIKDFNIRKNLPVGLKLTLRGEQSKQFLKEALWVKDNKVPIYSFDSTGNLHFGISDYTEFKGMKYDPDIGIFGLNVSVIFKRKGGYRNKYRKTNPIKIPAKHKLTKGECIQYMVKNFDLNVVEEY